MRAHRPVIRIVDQQIVVRIDLTAADELPPLEVRLPSDRGDLLDPTATAALPVLATLAAARGEDLHIDAPVEPRRLVGARRLAAALAERWGSRAPTIDAADEAGPGTPGSGVGLFFSRGVDSWSTLLDLLAAPEGERVTRLYTVHHSSGPFRPIDAEIFSGHRRVAEALELDIVFLSTTARRLLDPVQPWIQVAAPVLVSAGLTAGADLARLVLSSEGPESTPSGTSTGHDVMTAIGTGAVEVVTGNPSRTRAERVAHVLGDPLARATLQVCWEGLTAGNCGRCLKCQHTLGALVLAGDPDPARGFDHGPDPAIVAGLDPAVVAGPQVPAVQVAMVQPLAADLPPEHEALRRAWADVIARGHGEAAPVRWGDGDPPAPGLAGPPVAVRVAAALRASTGSADHPPAPPLGWRAGAVPLRPALADQARARRATATVADRPVAWAVVEPQIRDGARDGSQAGLALAVQDAHGAGVAYLPGILWAHLDPPVLGPAAVRSLLTRVRARLWWRADGDLDALRLVETIEAGCLPLQVMPTGAAHDLRAALPPPLVDLVVADGDVPGLDLSGPAVAARLAPAVDHVLAGNPEHDLLIGAHGG